MGIFMSSEEKEQKAKETAVELYDNVPLLADVGIDRSLQEYSGLDSLDMLQRKYTSQLQGLDWAGQMRNLGAGLLGAVGPMLASETPFPLAVGIGAVVVSMVLDKILNSSGESSVDLLQRIFMKQKEEEVEDLMEEYLKRHQMHLFDPRRLEEELRHWERLLSAQLTRLKNSMLKDGPVSSNTLKIWVNGAAFHTQMLIHLARLQQGGSTPARVAISTYTENLQVLLGQYRTFKASTITLQVEQFFEMVIHEPTGISAQRRCFRCVIRDRELKTEDIVDMVIPFGVSCSSVLESYLDHMISHDRQSTGLQQYFSDSLRNLDALIAQRGEFRYST